MDQWLILALLSNLFYAISSSIDKYIMNGRSNPIRTNATKMFFDGTILLAVGLIFFNIHIDLDLLVAASILGLTYAGSGIAYFLSLKTTNVNVIMPLNQSAVLFVFLFAVFFLNEAVDLFDYIAVMLVFLGSYVIVSNKKLEMPRLDPGLVLIIIMVLFASLWAISAKVLVSTIEPISLAITMYYFSSVFTFAYSFLNNKEKSEIEIPKIALTALFGSFGTLLLYLAFAIENASKVYSIGGIRSVFVFFIAAIFLKEKFNLNVIIGTLMVILGIYLIST